MHKKSGVVKNYSGGKSEQTVNTDTSRLCKAPVYIPRDVGLWKTPVEKTVENVENSMLSTGIPALCPEGGGCGEMCIRRCIFFVFFRRDVCYVTAVPEDLMAKKLPKSYFSV